MENQEQNPPQQEQPFVAAKQVSFNLEDIFINTNNEVSFFVPTGGIYDEVGVNTFRNAIGAHYLPHSREYIVPSSIDIVRPWFKTIGYGETIPAKGTLKKSLLPPSLANGINIDYASIFWEDIIIKLNKRHREKVVPYTRFLSLLMMHKMKEGYEDGEITPYPTQVYSVNNWALKSNQPEEPPFIDHMLAICTAAKLHSTSSKQPPVPSSEATKGGSSKAPNGSKTSHLKGKKESSSAMDSNPSQTSASTPMVAEMHKQDQQATGGPTSLGVTSEERVDPQLSSGMSAFNLNEPIFSSSFIIHSESASGNDALAVSTAKADSGKLALSDFVPQQQGMNEGTKITSYDHLFAGIDPRVLADKTQSVSKGLETVLTQPIIGKGASSIARQVEEDEALRTIKLEDLAKLGSSVQLSFKDLDSPEDDPIIVVDDSDKDEEANKVHATINVETKDTSVPKSSSPSNSLPTELKELPSKFNELTKEVKGLKNQVHNLEIELPEKLKEIPTKLEDFTKTVKSLTSQAKLKILDAFPILLHKVTNALNQFAQAIASKKTKDTSVSSVSQASTQPAEGEKNINQATISQLFQRKAAKNAT
ncbi:hypothetical protein Tco_1410851 [Tanacetum coccineum]